MNADKALLAPRQRGRRNLREEGLWGPLTSVVYSCLFPVSGSGGCCWAWLFKGHLWPEVCLADTGTKGLSHLEWGQNHPYSSLQCLSLRWSSNFSNFPFSLAQSKSWVACRASALRPALPNGRALSMMHPCCIHPSSFIAQEKGEGWAAHEHYPRPLSPIPLAPGPRWDWSRGSRGSQVLAEAFGAVGTALRSGRSMGASVPPPARPSGPAGAATMGWAPTPALCAKAPRRAAPSPTLWTARSLARRAAADSIASFMSFSLSSRHSPPPPFFSSFFFFSLAWGSH